MARMNPITIPLGQGGINTSKSISTYPITDLSEAENVTSLDDIMRKIGGAIKINTTPISGSPRIMGIHHFVGASSDDLIAATGDGKIVTVVTGGIGVTLKTGLGLNKLTVMVEGGGGTTKKLFIANGNDVVQVLDDGAASTGDIATPPVDWSGNNQPIGLTLHAGGSGAVAGARLVGWGNANDPHRLYMSVPGDHEDFQGAGSATVSVFPGEGEGVRSCISYKKVLIIFKYPVGVYILDDSAADVTHWTCKIYARGHGTASPKGAWQAEDDIEFIGANGLIYRLSGIQEFGDLSSGAILPDKIQDFVRQNILLGNLDRAVGMYVSSLRKSIVCVTKIGTSPLINNAKIILEHPILRAPAYFWDTKDICETIALRKDSTGELKPVIGDSTGTVWQIENESRSHDIGAYTGKFATGDIIVFPKGIRRANIHFIEIIFRPTGNWDLSMDVELDGVFYKTLLFNMSGGGLILGIGMLGTATLGGAGLSNLKKRVGRDARRIRLICYNSGDGQDFQISEIIIHRSQGNDRR